MICDARLRFLESRVACTITYLVQGQRTVLWCFGGVVWRIVLETWLIDCRLLVVMVRRGVPAVTEVYEGYSERNVSSLQLLANRSFNLAVILE